LFLPPGVYRWTISPDSTAFTSNSRTLSLLCFPINRRQRVDFDYSARPFDIFRTSTFLTFCFSTSAALSLLVHLSLSYLFHRPSAVATSAPILSVALRTLRSVAKDLDDVFFCVHSFFLLPYRTISRPFASPVSHAHCMETPLPPARAELIAAPSRRITGVVHTTSGRSLFFFLPSPLFASLGLDTPCTIFSKTIARSSFSPPARNAHHD